MKKEGITLYEVVRNTVSSFLSLRNSIRSSQAPSAEVVLASPCASGSGTARELVRNASFPALTQIL